MLSFKTACHSFLGKVFSLFSCVVLEKSVTLSPRSICNLAGQRINRMQRGINIANGKEDNKVGNYKLTII